MNLAYIFVTAAISPALYVIGKKLNITGVSYVMPVGDSNFLIRTAFY